VEYGQRDVKSVYPEVSDSRTTPSYHDVLVTNLFRQKNGVATSRASVSTSTPCPYNASAKQIMFIHIPKTGGESVESAFNLTKNHALAGPRHDAFFNDDEKRNDIFVISVIRNPFSRTWSWFHFCVHGWHANLPRPWAECRAAVDLILDLQNSGEVNEISVRGAFSSWLYKLDQNENATFTGEIGGHLDGIYLWTSMSEWIVDPITNTSVPDYIIHYETFRQDWDKLCSCLGIRRALPHENDSGGDAGIQAGIELTTVRFLSSLDYRTVYDEKSEAIVLKWFGDDFTRFGYSKDVASGV
jgi:hypothetical protein